MHSPLRCYCSCHLWGRQRQAVCSIASATLTGLLGTPAQPPQLQVSLPVLCAAAAGFTCRCVGQVEWEHAGVEVVSVVAADRLNRINADLGRSPTQLPIHVRGGLALGQELACPCQLKDLHRTGSAVLDSVDGVGMAAKGSPWPAQKQAAGASPSLAARLSVRDWTRLKSRIPAAAQEAAVHAVSSSDGELGGLVEQAPCLSPSLPWWPLDGC